MAREKICGIYKITNLINGKVYIGQSTNIERRWKDHKRMFNYKDDGSLKYNYPLYCAFRKYGEKNFKFEIIEECSEEELNEKEILYIKKHNSYVRWKNSNGYNQTLGGESNSGESNPCAKIVYCEGKEFGCAKNCAEYYGVGAEAMRSWLNKGRPMPKEWYDKGLRYFDETMENYKIQTGNNGEYNPRSIPVYCEGKKFANVRECAEQYGINEKTIKNWLNGNNNMPKEWYDKQLHQEGKTMNDYKIQNETLTGRDNPNSKHVYCDGVKYNSVKEFTQKYNLVYTTVMSWLYGKSNMPQEWYDRKLHFEGGNMDEYKVQTGHLSGEDNPNSIAIVCEGIRFGSIRECESYYGLNRSGIGSWVNGKHKMPKYWYDKGLRLENKTMEDYEYYETHRRVVCENKYFNTLNEFCKEYNLKKASVKNWLNHNNKMPKEWYDKGLRYEEESMEDYEWTTYKSRRRVVCDGIVYETAEKFAKTFDLKIPTLNDWLNGRKTMPDSWYNKGLRYEDKSMEDYVKRGTVKRKNKSCNKKVICDGIIFNSITECAKYYKCNPTTMGKWLKGKNPMPQEFKNKGLKYYEKG